MSVEIKNVSFSYERRHPVLKNITFTAASGKMLCLLGPNGVGKSTLFRCILGFLREYTGSIFLDGEDVKSLKQRQMAKLVAYIPQNHRPVFNYTALDVVLMGTAAQLAGRSAPSDKEYASAFQAMKILGIESYSDKLYDHLSGGEMRLVLIARALAQQSRILIMDEPAANLDFGNQMRVNSALKMLCREGYTIIQSTHHPEQAYYFADAIIALKDGEILASGSASDVITASVIKDLYGVSVSVQSLLDDTVRVCIPLPDTVDCKA